MIWSENLNKPGSGRTHFLCLARAFAADGHEVVLVAPGYPPRTRADLGVPVRYVPTLQRGLPAFLLFHLLLLPAVPWLLLRHRPDVVYTRGLFHSFLIHVLCRLWRKPYVAEVDSMVDQELAMRGRRVMAGLVRLLDRWNLRWASGFVCVTEGLRDELARRGARAERLHVVHNGAAKDIFRPGDRLAARRRLGLPESSLLAGFAGTLAAWQGLDLLVEAAARLKASGRPWQVLIIGDGEVGGVLAAQIAKRELEDVVTLVPAVPHDEVVRWMQAMDMLVVPIHDGRKLRYGLSVLKFWEALATGLPVLVPGGCGLGPVLERLDWPGEYAAGDAEDLALAMQRTAERLEELRARREQIHEIVAREYSWAAVARRVSAVFERLPRTQAKGGRT